MRKDNYLVRDCIKTLNNIDRLQAYLIKRTEHLLALRRGIAPPSFKIQVFR